MRIFLSSLFVLTHLLCLPLPSAAVIARDGTDAGHSQVNHEVADSSTDTPMSARSWTSILNPSYIVEGLKNAYIPSALRLTGAVQTFVESKQSSSYDFWEEAKKYEQILQDYIPRLLRSAAAYFKSTKFTDITSAMHNIVRATANFRSSIQDVLDVHHVTLDVLTEELEKIFTSIVHDIENIPAPDKAPSHAEREEMVDKILDDTEAALVDLAMRYGIDVKVVTTYLHALRPQLHLLVVAVGDINEQHPQLLPTIAFSVVGMLIPESWILRPLLSLFGFGPAGPVKGSAAAWLQRRFWGAAVKAGSWFSLLQAAGMGVIPKWAGTVIKIPLAIGGGLLAMFLPCFNSAA